MRRILYILCLIVLLASCDQRLEIYDPKEEVQTPLPDAGDSSEDGESDSDIDSGGSDDIEGDDTGGDDEDGDPDMDDGHDGSDGGNADDAGGNSGDEGGSGGDGSEEVETGLTIRFAEGVSLESGWYDVNKVKDGTVNGDINMCWAATAANILQWWQDRYVEQGNELPEGCPDGKGETYELAIMEVFHTQWDNTYGGHAFHAVKWYFEGVNVCEGWSRQAQPLQRGSGGYFKHEWEQIEPYMYTGHDLGYTQDYNNYYLWGSGSGLNATGRLKAFTELVELFIDKGMTSMAIAQRENYGGVHHSVTLWGYEKDNETGLLTRIWITDSDDSAQWPREPVLHEYNVSSTESGTIKFSGDVYAACYPVSLYPVSGYLSGSIKARGI